MVGRLLFALSIGISLALASAGVAADNLTAREIMERVDARDDGEDSSLDLTMILIDKRGNQRVRQMRAFARDEGENEQSAFFFLSPADVERTGFLTYNYDDEARDDDQWLYLPALSRTKRIASGDKSGSFMGSDFSFADLTKRPLGAYEYHLLGEGKVAGHPVWQVEGIPITDRERDQTGVEKGVVFVRKDNFVVVRAVYWRDKGSRLKYLDVKELEQIDGIWVPTEVHMTTKQGKRTLHKTVMRSSNVVFNQGISPEFFTLRQLEKGL